jgi:hypothetical protein
MNLIMEYMAGMPPPDETERARRNVETAYMPSTAGSMIQGKTSRIVPRRRFLIQAGVYLK